MVLSTQTHYAAKTFGLPKAIDMIADAGFDALDLSMFYEQQIAWIFEDGYKEPLNRALQRAKNRGLFFNQAHAPFPTLKENDPEYNKINLPRVIRAIEAAGAVGAKNVIVHPVAYSEAQTERNVEMYTSLAPVARENGVKIAIENMWGRDPRRGVICKNVCSDAEGLLELFHLLPSDCFTVCLDLGHIGLVGDYEAPTIRALGADALTCVHVHDNDYKHDAHTAPFLMDLPWKEIANAFADIGYRGDITLEADDFLRPLPPTLYAAGLSFMHAAGRELIRMIGEAERSADE